MLLLEFARRQKKWSQQTLGDLPTVRIHQTFVSQFERGTGVPSQDQRERLARALDVDPDRLLDPVIVTTEEETASA
jgi:transcriptional regulator with XRE-family HTH domain